MEVWGIARSKPIEIRFREPVTNSHVGGLYGETILTKDSETGVLFASATDFIVIKNDKLAIMSKEYFKKNFDVMLLTPQLNVTQEKVALKDEMKP